MNKRLFHMMVQHLTIGELHALCYKLGVEYGDLKGKNRETKTCDLFIFMQEQGRLDELQQAIQSGQRRSAAKTVRPPFGRRDLILAAATLLIIAAAISAIALLTSLNSDPDVSVQVAGTGQVQQQEPLAEPPLGTASPAPKPVIPGPLTISYADAQDWLETLPPEEHEDQILDWAMWGLAGHLELDTEALRNAFYDQTMVRNAAFEDMAVLRVGPGRGFADGHGTLHLLAPATDPEAPRAIALVLDDYRKDAGIDPDQVLIYRYDIDHEAQQVVLTPDEEGYTAETVRQSYGYHEVQIDSMAALQRFLDSTQHLSSLELRAGQLWATGWHWPGTPAGQVTAQDLTVLQRGYRHAAQGLWPEPGFSLDPGEPLSVAEFLELLVPDLYPKLAPHQQELATFIAEMSQADTEPEQTRVLQKHRELVLQVFDNDEYVQLLPILLDTEEGRPPYQKTRYDGGLQGTEAGMTYFYTDIVAKAWPMEKGSGAPVDQVPGFVSDLQAQIPWGHCKLEDQSGRLWFGLREEAISIHDTRIDLGSVTTRVFTRVTDPVLGDREIEPSYSFGRIVWWWDRHYLAMADYEPQYHRLDQLMRWGAAIAWLVEENVVLLPELPDTEIIVNRQFGEWLAAHPELKWHFDIPFVEPQGETTEALLTLYSDPYEHCGKKWTLSGGISSPPIERIVIIEESRPDLSPEIARAGLRKVGTMYSPTSQSGAVTNLDGTLSRTLNPVEDSSTRVDTVANGRKVWSLGTTKLWVSEMAPRKIRSQFSAKSGRISQFLYLQNVSLGELSATTQDTITSIHWEPGILDQAQRFFASLEEALPERSLLNAIAATEPVPPVYTESGGEQVLVQLCTAADPCWFAIEEGLLPATDKIAFRLGVPSGSLEPVWYTAYPCQPPD